MTNRLTLRAAAHTTAVCGLLASVPQAFAQTAPSTGAQPASAGIELQEVVVTARKFVENLQTVPVSITAITGAQLQQQSVKNIWDIGEGVPSLYIQEAGDDIQSLELTLRGRKQNDTASTLDGSVGVYVDGLYYPRTIGMAGSLVDIHEAQVLRGPQGTLYGRNTTGGALVINTNDPTDQSSGSIDVTAGNNHSWNVIGIANTPINDHLQARFVLQRGKDDGFGQNAVGGALDSQDSMLYRAKLRATWGSNWEAVLEGDYQSNRTGGTIVKLIGITPANFEGNGLPAGGLTNLETQAELGLTADQATSYLNSAIANSSAHFWDNESTTDEFSYAKRYDFSINLRGDLGDGLSIHSITGYQNLYRNSYFPPPIAVIFFHGASHTTSEYYSEEFQLLGRTPTLNWIAGLYAGDETGYDNVTSLVLPALAGPALGYQVVSVTNWNASAFAQATWQFIPDWHLTAGIRYSHDSRGMNAGQYVGAVGSSCQIPAPGVESLVTDPTGFQCPRAFKNAFAKPNWLVSLDHQVSANLMAYVKVATGYRSGGEQEAGAIEEETFTPFQPETNTEYEAGIKSEFFDHRARLNFDGYYDDYKNLQVSTAFVAADGNFATRVSNAATAKIEGLEAEGDLLLTPAWRLHATTTYTDARYGSFFELNPTTGLIVNRTHQPWSVPKFMASLSSTYTRSVPVGSLLFEVDYDWKGAVNLDGNGVLQNQLTQGPVGLLNGRISLHVDSWDTDIALWGRNITDKRWYDQVFQFEGLGVNMGYAAPGITAGLELTKHFGAGE